jgi:hypothetical protein
MSTSRKRWAVGPTSTRGDDPPATPAGVRSTGESGWVGRWLPAGCTDRHIERAAAVVSLCVLLLAGWYLERTAVMAGAIVLALFPMHIVFEGMGWRKLAQPIVSPSDQYVDAARIQTRAPPSMTDLLSCWVLAVCAARAGSPMRMW